MIVHTCGLCFLQGNPDTGEGKGAINRVIDSPENLETITIPEGFEWPEGVEGKDSILVCPSHKEKIKEQRETLRKFNRLLFKTLLLDFPNHVQADVINPFDKPKPTPVPELFIPEDWTGESPDPAENPEGSVPADEDFDPDDPDNNVEPSDSGQEDQGHDDNPDEGVGGSESVPEVLDDDDDDFQLTAPAGGVTDLVGALASKIDNGGTAPKKPATRRGATNTDEPTNAEMKAWFDTRGIKYPARGRLSGDLVNRYKKAHGLPLT